MNLTFLIFTCIIILTVGALLGWYVSTDDFDGCWISIGVMEGDRLIIFPGGAITHELRFSEDSVQYLINGEHVPVTRSGKTLRAELAAQICIEYRLSISEGRLVMTDPGGMRVVFEKIEREVEAEDLWCK